MKKTKILIPAMSVLALGMAASVAGTVAWFYTNDIANATGMAVKTHVPTSLYIEKNFFALNDTNSLWKDAIEYNELASEINECHMGTLNLAQAGENNVVGQLDGLTPSDWTTEPTQNTAGVASAYAVAGSAVLSYTVSNEVKTPVVDATGLTDRAFVLRQSIVRKTNEAGTYTLKAKVTISGIDGRSEISGVGHYEAQALQAFRVGFLSSKDGGATWAFVGQQQSTAYSTPANGGHEATFAPSAVADLDNQTSIIYSSYQNVLASCNNNEVIAVCPVMWIEGTDDGCTALKYQNQYNWTIDIEYKISE